MSVPGDPASSIHVIVLLSSGSSVIKQIMTQSLQPAALTASLVQQYNKPQDSRELETAAEVGVMAAEVGVMAANNANHRTQMMPLVTTGTPMFLCLVTSCYSVKTEPDGRLSFCINQFK